MKQGTLLRSGECLDFFLPDSVGIYASWRRGKFIHQEFLLTTRSLLKDPHARPTYAQLMEHPWLLADKDAEVDMPAWVAQQQEVQASRGVVPLAEVEA
jgi:hypothetical protein